MFRYAIAPLAVLLLALQGLRPGLVPFALPLESLAILAGLLLVGLGGSARATASLALSWPDPPHTDNRQCRRCKSTTISDVEPRVPRPYCWRTISR